MQEQAKAAIRVGRYLWSEIRSVDSSDHSDRSRAYPEDESTAKSCRMLNRVRRHLLPVGKSEVVQDRSI